MSTKHTDWPTQLWAVHCTRCAAAWMPYAYIRTGTRVLHSHDETSLLSPRECYLADVACLSWPRAAAALFQSSCIALSLAIEYCACKRSWQARRASKNRARRAFAR